MFLERLDTTASRLRRMDHFAEAIVYHPAVDCFRGAFSNNYPLPSLSRFCRGLGLLRSHPIEQRFHFDGTVSSTSLVVRAATRDRAHVPTTRSASMHQRFSHDGQLDTDLCARRQVAARFAIRRAAYRILPKKLNRTQSFRGDVRSIEPDLEIHGLAFGHP